MLNCVFIRRWEFSSCWACLFRWRPFVIVKLLNDVRIDRIRQTNYLHDQTYSYWCKVSAKSSINGALKVTTDLNHRLSSSILDVIQTIFLKTSTIYHKIVSMMKLPKKKQDATDLAFNQKFDRIVYRSNLSQTLLFI